MAVLGAYEKDGEVVIEYSDHEPSTHSWREALTRLQGILPVEAAAPKGRREISDQVIEQIIAAARDARKKEDETYQPPAKISMYKQGAPSPQSNTVVSKPKSNLILPN